MEQLQSELLLRDYADGLSCNSGGSIVDFYHRGRDDKGDDIYELEVTPDSGNIWPYAEAALEKHLRGKVIDKSYKIENGVEIVIVWIRRRVEELNA